MSELTVKRSDLVASGVAWLGPLPRHWSLKRLKHIIYALESGVSVNATDYPAQGDELGVLKTSCVYTGSFRGEENKTVVPEERSRVKCRVRRDSIIISRMNTPELVGASGLVVNEYPNLFLPDRLWQTVFHGDAAVAPKYIAYFLGIDGFRRQVSLAAEGASSSMQNVAKSDFLAIRVAIPPRQEQLQIARFLDYETARIDALIEKQQQLIALLKEKRQAVISHAVTKGLNPNAPLRDSGVEWLGMVPAHWKVCRVKQATSFITSGPRGWSDLIADDGADVFLQSGDLNDAMGLVLTTAKRISPPRNAEGIRTRMQAGDVVVCITGANTGRVAVADELHADVYVNQHLSLVRPKSSAVAPRFLATVLSSTALKSYFAVAQYGLKGGLSLTNVAEAPLVLPPLDEQRLIVNELRAKEKLMDSLEVAATAQIELLQERRTALISAAVTGKIDVRNWTPPKSKPEQDVA